MKSEVDAILAKIPADKRTVLEFVRKTIRAAAPGAEEGISYGVPAFRYKGKPLAGYAASKEHCSYFPMSPAVITKFKNDLKRFETAKGTIRFTPNRPLSATLIKKLVKARMAEIDTQAKK